VRPLEALDSILMRKDPPFDSEYVYATQVLERAEVRGVTVANRPQALRDVSEKLALALFAEFAPPTLVSARHAELLAFLAEFGDIVVKPLDGMGGRSIFRIRSGDDNRNVILETLSGGEKRLVMAQQYLPRIADGDKRVLVVDGEPIPFTLARIPQGGDLRGNLAAGGRGEVQPITAGERRIAEALGHPSHDPHGDPIPSRELILPQSVSLRLCDLAPGDRAEIRRVADTDNDVLRYLSEVGLTPGVRLRVVVVSPFEDIFHLQIDEKPQPLVLGLRIARQIFVELTP